MCVPSPSHPLNFSPSRPPPALPLSTYISVCVGWQQHWKPRVSLLEKRSQDNAFKILPLVKYCGNRHGGAVRSCSAGVYTHKSAHKRGNQVEYSRSSVTRQSHSIPIATSESGDFKNQIDMFDAPNHVHKCTNEIQESV